MTAREMFLHNLQQFTMFLLIHQKINDTNRTVLVDLLSSTLEYDDKERQELVEKQIRKVSM